MEGLMIDYHRLPDQPAQHVTARCDEHGTIMSTLDHMERHTAEKHPGAVGYRCVPPREAA